MTRLHGSAGRASLPRNAVRQTASLCFPAAFWQVAFSCGNVYESVYERESFAGMKRVSDLMRNEK